MLTVKWPKKLPNPSHKVNYAEMLVQSQLGHYYSCYLYPVEQKIL